MKMSNKLLTGLFAAIIIALIAVNIVLKNEYKSNLDNYTPGDAGYGILNDYDSIATGNEQPTE